MSDNKDQTDKATDNTAMNNTAVKVAVRYFSKGGNTKKVAEAIARAAGCEALDLSAPLEGPVDILFIGASVYWGGIKGDVKNYIQTLDKDSIGKAVIFSTSGLTERAYPQMSKLLQTKGICVAEDNFYCRGQFTALHKGHPDEADLKNAAQFAKDILAGKTHLNADKAADNTADNTADKTPDNSADEDGTPDAAGTNADCTDTGSTGK